MNYSSAKALTGLAFSVCSMSALAAPIDLTQSEVKATFKQFNVPVSGNFKKFTGDVQYDPAKPADTKATLGVDTASYDLGDPEYNKEVAGKDWFDSKNHPKATFVITGVTGSGSMPIPSILTLAKKERPQERDVSAENLFSTPVSFSRPRSS